MNVTLRNVDEVVFKKFKVAAVERGLGLGKAVTQALLAWLHKKKVAARKSIFEFSPIRFGKGTEKLSREIDVLLYGGRT